MNRILLPFLLLFASYNISAQIGAGPATDCTSSIPEICPGGSYPASIAGIASAPGASFSCTIGGTNTIEENPSFFYFEAGVTGPLTMQIDPTDPFTGAILFNPQDLDFMCWGPFSNTATMCNGLTATNLITCSYSPGSTEYCFLPNVIAGQFYVILVTNWSSGTPADCNIQFTPDTSLAGGGFAGANATITPCSTDPSFNLINQLNGIPDGWGVWINASNNIVDSIFDPATDPGGVYRYVIGGTTTCPGDTAWLTIDLVSGATMSITSSPTSCSDDSPLTLTGSPIGGTFSGNGVNSNIFTPDISMLGSNIIEYIYQSNGCSDTVTQDLVVYESPIVLPADVLTTNPLCFGDCDGIAIITATLGTPLYNYNWYGMDPLALCSGTFNYIVTDDNGCTFSSDVTLYDPQNNLGVLTAYPSSCFGDNNGAISVTMNAGVTPPGTVSLLAYCQSSSNTVDFPGNMDAIIEEVILNGDANNINNNTAGVVDYYEDYTATMYADITEGQSYTVDLILGDLSVGGSYPTGAKVFIDYNIDGDFDDTGEEIGILNCTWVSPLVGSINFTVPSTGAFGPTRMRVVSQDAFVNPTASIGPCDYADPTITNSTPWFGATEDYSIVIHPATVTATFSWSNGQTTDSIFALEPDTYIVTITPSSGCAAQDTAVVLEPEEITFSPTITDISCNTFTDGQITLNPSGGNGGAYTFDWGVNNPLALGNGSYLVTVADPSTITVTNLVACENDTTITIIEPAYFSVDFTVSSNEICLDEPLTLDFDFNQGGVPDFIINYTENANPFSAGPFSSPGQIQVSVTPNVGNNTYLITSITDSAGCVHQNTIGSEDVYVNPLPDINISVAPNPICVGDDATLLFSVPNGTPPYVVDYFVNGVASIQNVPSAGASLLVSPIVTTVYDLSFVTDNKGCTANLTDNTTLVVNEIPQVTISYPTEFCEGEAIEIDLNFTVGSPPFDIDYTFNGPSTSTTVNNQQSTLSFVSTNPTNIVITTITSNNCKNDINETISITTNPLPIATISGNYELCDDGEEAEILVVTTDGNPLYDIVYTNGESIYSITNATSNQTFNTNISGIYTLLSVTDTKGCESVNMSGFATVIINPLPEASISAYPTHTEITDPLIYFEDRSNSHISGVWDFGDGQTQASNFNTINHIYSDTGTYQVSLTTLSIDGCENTAYQTIIITPSFTIYIPNAFTPNNDLDNDYFMPILEGVQDFEMSIYDRLGQRVFRTTDYSNEYCIKGCSSTWDGTINGGEYGTIGIYIYNLVITDINGKVRNFEGPITLIR